MTACNRTNPFFEEWDTPYGIPPYGEIQYQDYLPAIKEGIRQQEEEIQAIVNNPDAPDFENTIAALEQSGKLLAKVSGVFYNVLETENCPELDAIEREAIPVVSSHSDNIAFNKALYNRVAAVYNSDQSALDEEQKMVLKNWMERFENNGIALPEEEQDKLREINTAMASKIQKLGNNILAESNAFKEKFGFSVGAYPDMMTSTADRELRRQYNEAYTSRCHNGNEYDNRQLILEIMDLRIKKANILGYSNPADQILSSKMAHDHQTVDKFLSDIMAAAVQKAGVELADMQKVMDEDIKAGLLPEGSKIEPWDWWYYAERVRKAKYDLDEELTKPYFHIDNVMKGVFLAANRLYGIKAEPLENVPVYNPGVKTYKITDADGSLVGIFTTDPFPRDSKRGGAWMNNVRDQYVDENGNEVRPIIVNVCNFTEYLSIDNVQTAFHEFGHALHGLLSKCRYPSVSGTSVKRDFVEMFSQFNENWAFQPDLLKEYARNDKGEVIPAELVEKINNSLKFNQGFMTTELCAASMLDMYWHELESVEGIDVDEFEAKVAEKIGLIPEITFRYRSTYFNHIFASGYSAGYYGYLWAEVLDKDAFSAFEQAEGGVWNIDLATKFRKTFLERGGSRAPMELYKEFMGREPDSRAMLRARGLVD